MARPAHKRKPTTLVAILPDNNYVRFEGKIQTHHVRSTEGPMSAAHVEAFRVDPESFFPPNDDDGGDHAA